MSNLTKHAIKIPSNIFIKIESDSIYIKGPLGEKVLKLSVKIFLNANKEIIVTDEIQTLLVKNKTLSLKAAQGSTYALIKQIFLGLSVGFREQLKIIGVGYRASVDNKSTPKVLTLKLGYSHPVLINIPTQLKIICIKPTLISIFGSDKQEVNQMAALIKSYKMPEPYKGKGILYQDEKILRKEGKRS